jgi:hypothetical protein
VGFSVIRTTCEELLQDDPRILPSNRKALAAAISEVSSLLSGDIIYILCCTLTMLVFDNLCSVIQFLIHDYAS